MGVGVVTHKVWRERKRTRKISTFEGQAGKEKPASDAKNEQWKENRRSKGVGSGSQGKQRVSRGDNIKSCRKAKSDRNWKGSSDSENCIICNFSNFSGVVRVDLDCRGLRSGWLSSQGCEDTETPSVNWDVSRRVSGRGSWVGEQRR